MIQILKLLLQCAGVTMMALGLVHFYLSNLLDWSNDTKKLQPINRQVFIVHTVFLAIGIFLLGVVCCFYSGALVEKTELGLLATACFGLCWFSRLLCQIFIFRSELTSNKGLNTFLQIAGMMLWLFYTGLFVALFLHQAGVLSH